MDTMANESVLDAPSEGQAQRANTEQYQGESDGQASQGKPVNEKDNIRKLQSSYDQKLFQQQQAFQAQQQQYNNVIANMQARLNQMEDAGAPDDYTKLENQLKREVQARQYAEQAYYQLTAQQRAAQEQAQQKNNALKEIADRYGLDPDDLADTKDYFDAIDRAHELRDKRKEQSTEEAEQKVTRNRPDVGGGRTSTPSNRWERDYKDAQERNDTTAQMRLLRIRPTKGG